MTIVQHARTELDLNDSGVSSESEVVVCDNRAAVSRRAALGIGFTAGAAVLAACASAPQSPSGPSPVGSSVGASSGVGAPATLSESSSASSSGSATSAETSSAAAASMPGSPPSDQPESSMAAIPTTANYGALEAIPEGSALVAGPENAPVALARTGTTVVAFSAVCTHQGCTVNARGAQLICPCHASKFDPLTGAVQGGPAPSPLPAVAVQVVEGIVYGA